MSPALQSTLFLILTFFLVILNGFFVATEFALVKVRATRIEELLARNVRGAKRVQHLQQHLDSYLSATQLGVTLASLGLGSLGEPTLAKLMEPLFEHSPLSHFWSHFWAAAIGFSAITYFHIIIGELIPKWAAIQGSEKIALACALPLDIFFKTFRLPIAILYKSAVVIAKLLHIEPSAEGGEAHSEEELRLILNASHAGGEINASEVQLVNQVFNFAHQQVREIMVPRPDVIFLSTDRPIRENARKARESGYTRFPLLIDNSPDDVVGMVHIRDLFDLVTRLDGAASTVEESELLRGIARDLPRVPETKPIDRLLREFQRGRQHMAVVVDEYGGTAGVVTLEDIVEEIVGDIQDEFDRTIPELEPAGKDCYSVDARMSLSKLERALDIEGPPEEPDVTTLGGWVLASSSGEAVRVGDEFAYGEATITVLEMAGRRVRKVRVCIPETSNPNALTAPIGVGDESESVA